MPGLGGDFAYLRCRRIGEGRLTEIDHEQVWTALQLTHCEVVGEAGKGAVWEAGDEEAGVIYVPRWRKEVGGKLRGAVGKYRGVIVYTWQSEVVRGVLKGMGQVQVEKVPESLARRFGMRV